MDTHVCKNYSVTNSAGATQFFSANHKTSSEQKNRSSFILDQSQMCELKWKVVYFHQQKGKKNIYWKVPQIFKSTKKDQTQNKLKIKQTQCKFDLSLY